MKVKTVIISVVVSASLVAGVGYGAYYAIRGKATPVEVVPVSISIMAGATKTAIPYMGRLPLR